MRAAASASGHDRPPSQTAAGQADAAVRPTARTRPVVPVELSSGEEGFKPSDPYVRRFWVAAIGPGAVTELLRLVRAAGKGEEVRLPRHLPTLIKAGLVTISDGALVVHGCLPVVPHELRWRFPPNLAQEHTTVIGERRAS